MKYEVQELHDQPGVWCCEAVNHDGEGEIQAVRFYGKDAESLARGYAFAREIGQPIDSEEMRSLLA